MAEGDQGGAGGQGGGQGGAGGQGGGAAGGQGGAGGGGQGGAGGGAPDFASLIPADYRDKPWVKETKDLGALFKRTDDLLTEIGKRPAGIPADNAKPEEIAAFNKAFGVPDKPEAYQLPEVPAGLPKNEKYIEGMRKVFIKAGVNARQAKILAEGNNELVGALMKEMGQADEAQDADFDKLAGETFGQRKDEALKGANILISKFVPEKMKAHVANLSNENLIVLAGVLDAVRKEYISEDRFPTGGGAPVGMTDEQKRAKGQELMASPAYGDPYHKDHEAVVAEVRRLYGTA